MCVCVLVFVCVCVCLPATCMPMCVCVMCTVMTAFLPLSFPAALSGGLNELQIAFVCREILKVSNEWVGGRVCHLLATFLHRETS